MAEERPTESLAAERLTALRIVLERLEAAGQGDTVAARAVRSLLADAQAEGPDGRDESA